MKKLLLALGLFLGIGANAQTKPASPAAKRPVKTSDGSAAFVTGPLKFKEILVTIDSTTSKDFVCVSFEINGITGSNFNDMLAADHNYSVFDKNTKPLPFKEKVLKKVGGAMEDNIVNYIIKLPYKLKTDKEKNYQVSYQLITKDKAKSIEVFVKTK